MDVKIYTTPTCGYCHQAKSYLDGLGVNYTEFDVSRDQRAAQEMVRITGQMGVPVITIDGQAVIGFDRGRIQALLAAGERAAPKLRMGVAIADASRRAARTVGAAISGAFVGRVAPGSVGERSGLRPGDVVVEINRQDIASAAEMEKALAVLEKGDVLSIVFFRGGDRRKSEIVI